MVAGAKPMAREDVNLIYSIKVRKGIKSAAVRLL